MHHTPWSHRTRDNTNRLLRKRCRAERNQPSRDQISTTKKGPKRKRRQRGAKTVGVISLWKAKTRETVRINNNIGWIEPRKIQPLEEWHKQSHQPDLFQRRPNTKSWPCSRNRPLLDNHQRHTVVRIAQTKQLSGLGGSWLETCWSIDRLSNKKTDPSNHKIKTGSVLLRCLHGGYAKTGGIFSHRDRIRIAKDRKKGLPIRTVLLLQRIRQRGNRLCREPNSLLPSPCLSIAKSWLAWRSIKPTDNHRQNIYHLLGWQKQWQRCQKGDSVRSNTRNP
jgi:hypothetical protein